MVHSVVLQATVFCVNRATFAPPTVLNVLRSWLRRRRSFNLAQVVWPYFGRCALSQTRERRSHWKTLAFSADLSPHGMVVIVYSFGCWELPQSAASCEPRCRREDSAALCCCLWSWIRRALTVLGKDRQGNVNHQIYIYIYTHIIYVVRHHDLHSLVIVWSKQVNLADVTSIAKR